jgi:hypothetical protein
VIGAVAGLVTGLCSALIALRVAKTQEVGARELHRRQWRADTLRDCYSQIGGTHRRYMLAWLDWWDPLNADHKREQHVELMQAASAFAAACTAVRIYAPENVVERLMNLKNLTDDFDKYAEERRDLERWTALKEAEYEQFRINAEIAIQPFINAARVSIEAVLSGAVD